MTTPGAGDAAMSFDSQGAVNNQGLKDLSIKASFPDGAPNLPANDVAHLKNQAGDMNGAESPVDSKPQVADINLPTPADSAVDPTAPAPLLSETSATNGLSVPVAMDTQPSVPAVAPAPEDPAVEQPTSELREPPEPVSQEQAAQIQAEKDATEAAKAEPASESAVSAVQEEDSTPALEGVPVPSEPPAPVEDTAMDPSDDKPAAAVQHAQNASVELPHHPSPPAANGETGANLVKPTPTPAAEAPAEVKAEAAPTAASQDVDMKDAPPTSPGKMSRSREDDSGLDEPNAKRMRPSSPAGSIPNVVASPANVGSPASPAAVPQGDRDFTSPITEPQQKAIAIVVANTKRSTHSSAFSRPVDPVALGIPTYPDIVKNPMDLGTMNDKLRRREYQTVQAFVDDFNLIVSNCEAFNGMGHPITGNVYKLRDTFDKQMTKVPSADYVEPPPPEKKKKIAAPRQPARRESRAAAQSKPAIAASPTQAFALNPDGMPLIRRDSTAVDGRPRREIHPPAPKDLPYSARPKKKKYQVELRFCNTVLQELDKAKYSSFVGPFKLPVDPVALNIPNYHKIIKKPMDLSTMKRKLDNGMYENAKDFDSDMRLILANCFKFNQGGDFVFQCGKQLEGEYEQIWQGKDDYIRKNAPETAHSASSPELESDEDEEEEEEEDEDASNPDQIQMLQAQIQAMGAQLAALQKNPAKKKKSPPVAAKKKGGKKDADKKAKKPDKKSGKKSSITPKYVTYEQKQDISNRINTLPENRMMQALEIIKNNMPNLKGADNDELELDIDELSNDVLYKLLLFVRKHAPRQDDEPAERRESYAPMQPARPKKNKPMGARDQETRIENLRRATGGGTVQQAAPADSSEDDEDSDDESEEE